MSHVITLDGEYWNADSKTKANVGQIMTHFSTNSSDREEQKNYACASDSDAWV
jgi:hypothetical protein